MTSVQPTYTIREQLTQTFHALLKFEMSRTKEPFLRMTKWKHKTLDTHLRSKKLGKEIS